MAGEALDLRVDVPLDVVVAIERALGLRVEVATAAYGYDRHTEALEQAKKCSDANRTDPAA